MLRSSSLVRRIGGRRSYIFVSLNLGKMRFGTSVSTAPAWDHITCSTIMEAAAGMQGRAVNRLSLVPLGQGASHIPYRCRNSKGFRALPGAAVLLAHLTVHQAGPGTAC